MDWFEEFRREIEDDHARLTEARARRRGGPWSFEVAVERTRAFYRERIGGFARCGSIGAAERDRLLGLVEAMGTDAFTG